MMLSLMGAVALTASAQETTAPAELNIPAHKTVFAHPNGGNWFVTLQGGAGAMFVNDNQNAKFGDRITWAASLAVGKWHSPYFASRVLVNGGESSVFTGANGENKFKNNYVGAQYDFMFDVINYFSPYREDRAFHLIPFVGLGYEYKFNNDKEKMGAVEIPGHVHALTANAGIQMLFRLGQRVDLVLEGMTTYNNFNLSKGYPSPMYNALRTTLTAGLNFRLGKTGFEVVTPMDYALIEDLNSQVNSLRSTNSELRLRPESCPECPEVKSVKQSSMLTEKPVLFRHGKSTVDSDQMINIFDASEFVKNNGGEIVVTGYTQANESRMAGLAEKRAKAVAQILTEKYNVPSDKVTVEWKESTEKAYDAKGWNRVVVIRSK